MSTKLGYWWQKMWSSYWFVPTLILLSAVALAILLVILESLGDLHLIERWPLFFGTSPSSASRYGTSVFLMRPAGRSLDPSAYPGMAQAGGAAFAPRSV